MENESINYDPTGLPSVEEMTAQIEEDAEKKQVIQESEAASVAADAKAAEQRRADELAAKTAEQEYNVAKGLYGSRSLFGKAGGRGYFDTV